MAVNGPGSVSGSVPIRSVRPPAEVSPTKETGKVTPANDRVEISAAARMLDELNESSAVHAERLAKIKSAIDAGEYETPDKLEAALEKMLREIGFDEPTS